MTRAPGFRFRGLSAVHATGDGDSLRLLSRCSHALLTCPLTDPPALLAVMEAPLRVEVLIKRVCLVVSTRTQGFACPAHVLCSRHRFQMSWVDAQLHPTQMIYLQPLRDGPYPVFVRPPVGPNLFPLDMRPRAEPAVYGRPESRCVAHPHPTGLGLTDESKEAFFWGSYALSCSHAPTIPVGAHCYTLLLGFRHTPIRAASAGRDGDARLGDGADDLHLATGELHLVLECGAR